MKTEQEMIGALRENFRLAAEECDKLANGKRGRAYLRLRDHLKTVEQSCRDIAHNRGDTRWLPMGLKMAEAHQLCGGWLRAREPSWRFKSLSEILRHGMKICDTLAVKKTGRLSGPILPVPLVGPLRETRPVQIILPPGYTRH